MSSTIELKHKVKGIQSYPNPANHTLYIKNIETVSAIINIFDLTGTKITSAQFDSTYNSIDVSGLLPGVYLVHIKDGNKIVTNKFIKE